MSWFLTDGDKAFVTIHDECSNELAQFVVDSVLEFIAREDYNEIRRCEVLEDDL